MPNNIHPTISSAFAQYRIQPIAPAQPAKPVTIRTDADILRNMDNELQDIIRDLRRLEQRMIDYQRRVNEEVLYVLIGDKR